MSNDELIEFINDLYKPQKMDNLILNVDLFEERSFLNRLKEVGLRVFQQTALDNGVFDVELQIEFINDIKINAIATCLRTRPLICVNIGCIMNLLHYSSLLSIRKDFFPKIGDLSKCLNNVKYSEYEFPEIVEEASGGNGIYFYVGSEDQSRQSIAALIASLAHAFLIFHELGHHIYGHTKLLNNVYGVSYLMAQDNKGFEKIDNVIIQCMETHADSYAIRKLSLMFIANPDTILDTDFPLLSKNEKFEILFEMLITSVSLVFLLMDNDGIDETNFTMAYYLPQRLRLDLMLRSLRTIMEENKDSEFARYCMQMDDFQLVVSQTYHKLRESLNEIREITDTNHDEQILFDDSIDNYYRSKILKRWQKLSLELTPYAIVKEV